LESKQYLASEHFWAKKLPDGWKYEFLSELISDTIDNRGRSVPTSDFGIPLIATNCISNSFLTPIFKNIRYVSQKIFNEWFRDGHAEPNNILFVNKGEYCGKLCLAPTPVNFCFAQDMIGLKVNKKKIDFRYLLAVLRTKFMQEQIRAFHVGTLIPHVRKTDFDKIVVPIPPKKIEKLVGAYYLNISKKIQTLQEQNKVLEEIIRTIFEFQFVNFDGITKLEDSELGQIPKGWLVKSLENILTELEIGGRPKGGVSNIKTGIPSIGAESIVGIGIFDYSKTKFVSEKFFNEMKKGIIKNRDVLLYKDGGRPGTFIPHVSFFGDGFPFDVCAINEHVYRLRVNNEITQTYLYFWLSSQNAMHEMQTKGTGAVVPGLNSTQVRSLQILIPKEDVLHSFDSISEPFISSIFSNCKNIQKLSMLRDSVLPKLMSEEFRI